MGARPVRRRFLWIVSRTASRVRFDRIARRCLQCCLRYGISIQHVPAEGSAAGQAAQLEALARAPAQPTGGEARPIATPSAKNSARGRSAVHPCCCISSVPTMHSNLPQRRSLFGEALRRSHRCGAMHWKGCACNPARRCARKRMAMTLSCAAMRSGASRCGALQLRRCTQADRRSVLLRSRLLIAEHVTRTTANVLSVQEIVARVHAYSPQVWFVHAASDAL